MNQAILQLALQSLEEPWQQLYKQKFGEVNSVVREAANLAKTWKELYKCKLATNKRADPWLTPCVYELAAIHQRIVEAHPSDQAAGGVVFLLDGSGSVFQGRVYLAVIQPAPGLA